MSAFILVKGNQEDLVQAATKTFDYRQMKKHCRFNISCGVLLLYQKELIDIHNYVRSGDKGLYAIGTPVYKGNSYEASLHQAFVDLESGNFDYTKMRGNYVLVYDNGIETCLIRDSLSMYKLFSDSEGNYVTSSFLVASSLQPITFNENAVVEQLLYGFISAPDTLVNEVKTIGDINSESSLAWIGTFSSGHVEANHSKGIDARCEEIINYMSDVKSFVNEFGAECGLSGGCDSRLIFASVNEVCRRMNSVHTHSTSDIHNKEIKTVKELATIMHVPVRIVPTSYLPSCDSDVINKTLKENVLFFDGRNANIIGACSQTHTRQYKERTSDGSGITFSGIGGEIYRNFYYTSHPFVFVKSWLNVRLFYQHVRKMVTFDVYSSTINDIKRKVMRDTAIGHGKFASWLFARRFFDHYRIPHALSNVVNANNQMKFYLAPFVERELIDGAAVDNAVQDFCGKYEGMIINRFNSQLASVISSKGYALNSIPLKYRIKWGIRSLYPSFVWSIREKCIHSPHNSFSKMLAKSVYLQDALNCICRIFPHWHIDAGAIPDNFMQNFVFTVCSIKEIENISHIR